MIATCRAKREFTGIVRFDAREAPCRVLMDGLKRAILWLINVELTIKVDNGLRHRGAAIENRDYFCSCDCNLAAIGQALWAAGIRPC
jgi:hypothetical protein